MPLCHSFIVPLKTIYLTWLRKHCPMNYKKKINLSYYTQHSTEEISTLLPLSPLTQTGKKMLILIPCIIDYIENNQLNALKLYTSLFFFNNGSYSSLSSPYSSPVCRFRHCLMTCLLPYWRWSGSVRKTVAPWGWHCFAETRRSHC
jgi:hypothetical protein